jgi:hypothetical protein
VVRSRTTYLLAVENITGRHQGGRLSSAQVQRLTPKAIEPDGAARRSRAAMQTNLAVIQTLSEQFGPVEKRLAEKLGPRAEYMLLKTVPGIGPILARACSHYLSPSTISAKLIKAMNITSSLSRGPFFLMRQSHLDAPLRSCYPARLPRS